MVAGHFCSSRGGARRGRRSTRRWPPRSTSRPAMRRGACAVCPGPGPPRHARTCQAGHPHLPRYRDRRAGPPDMGPHGRRRGRLRRGPGRAGQRAIRSLATRTGSSLSYGDLAAVRLRPGVPDDGGRRSPPAPWPASTPARQVTRVRAGGSGRDQPGRPGDRARAGGAGPRPSRSRRSRHWAALITLVVLGQLLGQAART